jgi:hypothetical protein
MILSSFNHARSAVARQVAALLVVNILLMQSVMAYLVTPMTVAYNTDDGTVTVVLCTLQGSRTITLDLPELADEAPAICSALELNHIVGSVSLAPPSPVLSLAPASQQITAPVLLLGHKTLHYSAFASRAPPAYT